MLKLKLQNFGYLMQRTDSLEKTLMLGKIEAGEERDDRGWDGWMASLIRWIWVWASSGSWWWRGKPGVLQSMGLQRVGHQWVTELNSVYSCHLFLIPSASIRSIPFLPFIVPIFAWNVPLVYLIFLKRSLVSHSIVFLYFFALITEEVFLISPCYSLELYIQMGVSFLLCFAFLFFSHYL